MDRPTDPRPLETFLVERYWPGIDLDGLRALRPRLDLAAQAILNERAALPVDRIAGAVALLRAGAARTSGTNERREQP